MEAYQFIKNEASRLEQTIEADDIEKFFESFNKLLKISFDSGWAEGYKEGWEKGYRPDSPTVI